MDPKELKKIQIDIRRNIAPNKVSKSAVINRMLGNPNEFHIMRRPNEGRKPIFAFLETVAAETAAVEAAKKSVGAVVASPPPPAQQINLIAKPLDEYEQKLMAELTKKEEDENERRVLSKLHGNRHIQVEEEPEQDRLRGRKSTKNNSSKGVERSGGAVAVASHRDEDRWRNSSREIEPPPEEMAAVGPEVGYGQTPVGKPPPLHNRPPADRAEGSRHHYSGDGGDGGWRSHSRGERRQAESYGDRRRYESTDYDSGRRGRLEDGHRGHSGRWAEERRNEGRWREEAAEAARREDERRREVEKRSELARREEAAARREEEERRRDSLAWQEDIERVRTRSRSPLQHQQPMAPERKPVYERLGEKPGHAGKVRGPVKERLGAQVHDTEGQPEGRANNYFDHHDHRHLDNSERRGNGRGGGYRGRGRWRGRGGGGHWNEQRESSGDWQHDMFAADEEQEPTSTTA